MKVVCNHYDAKKCKARFPDSTHSCHRGYFDEDDYTGFNKTFPKGRMSWHCGRLRKTIVQWEVQDFEYTMRRIIEEEDEKTFSA